MGKPFGDVRRRRLRFRAWHRGSRELDLLLGRFADTALAGMTASELDAFERLIETPDPDLFSYITGRAVPPPELDAALLRRIGAQAKRASQD
jgi:antitoxin CptB